MSMDWLDRLDAELPGHAAALLASADKAQAARTTAAMVAALVELVRAQVDYIAMQGRLIDDLVRELEPDLELVRDAGPPSVN